MDVRHLFIVSLVTSSFVTVGCKSDKSGQSLATTRAPSDVRATTALNDPRYDALIKEVEAGGGNVDHALPPQTTTEKVSGAFRNASHSVTNALTLKPKVVKAPDPLALDNMPKEIDIDLYYQAGRVAESNGNMALAVQHYERGLKDHPNHVPTLISLARLHDRRDEFHKAEKLYRRAMEAEPESAMTQNDLGLCLARHDRNDDAVVALQKACQLEPDRKLYHNNLATVLVAMGRVDEAFETLKRTNTDAVAHYNIGYLLYQSDKKEQAHKEFTLAFAADDTLTAAQDMLSQLDAEMARSKKTLVAHAQQTPAAAKRLPDPAVPETSAKVQYRIEDLAPQATSIHKRTEAQPVAMAHSGEPLRRTPTTDATNQPGTSTESATMPPGEEPLMPPTGAVGWPDSGEVRPMSGTSDDEPIRLPTPDLLEELKSKQ